jgi:hypothetical protein
VAEQEQNTAYQQNPDQLQNHYDTQAYDQQYAAYDQGSLPTYGNSDSYDPSAGSKEEQQAPPQSGPYDANGDSAPAVAADTAAGPPPFMFNPNSFGGQAAFTRQSSLGGRSREVSLSEPAPPVPGGVANAGQPPPPSATAVKSPAAMPATSSSNDKVMNKEKQAANSKNNIGAPAKKPSSWLGGIFGKFVRNSNQVHLPDDSDKKIVFDEKLGRWVNLDGDEDDLAPAAPPPMDPAFAAGGSGASPAAGPGTSAAAPTATSPTGFRAQPGKRRGRGYVDVFGQAGATKPVPVSPMMLDPMLPPMGGGGGGPSAGLPPAAPAIFNPTVTSHNNDDIPSGVMPGYEIPSGGEGLSGGGSGGGSSEGPPSMPMMFNPSYMAAVSAPPAF